MAKKATSIIKPDSFQYAHRFMDWAREAKHLHGHSGFVTIEVEDVIDPETGYAFPIKDARKIAWDEALDNFHHATILQEGDPLLEAILGVYKEHGVKQNPDNSVALKKLDHPLVWSYPEYRIVVTKKPSTCENLCEIFYELLKDKMPIKKIEMRSSPINAASMSF